MHSTFKIFDQAFGRGSFTSDKKNYQVPCPACKSSSGKKKLHISVDGFKYHCWVCGIKGKNAIFLAKKYLPNLDISSYKNTLAKIKSEESENDLEEVNLPKNLVPIVRKINDPDIRAVKKYLRSRGLSARDMFRWRVMTATSGPHRRYAFFPSFDNEGRLNYYLSRSIDDNSIRYKNAKNKKTNIIFNEIDINWKKTVILVEGVFDALKCPDNTIPILGSELSKKSNLYSQIVRNQCDIILSLDADCKIKAHKIADELVSAGCKVRTCFPPDGKDLGDLSKNEVEKILSTSKEHNAYSTLKYKIGVVRSGSVF